MRNFSLNSSQQTEKPKHINALACPLDQSGRRTWKSSPPWCVQDRVEMAVLEPLPMKQASGLADQTNPSSLSLYSAGERQIIRGREVARIYESDPVWIDHHVHWFILCSRYLKFQPYPANSARDI